MKENNNISGKTLAVYLKYYLQFKNKKIINPLPPSKIKALTFYKKYYKILENTVSIFSKYKIDPIKYIEFYVEKLNKCEYDIQKDFLSTTNILKYCDYLILLKQYNFIYSNFLKSAKFLAVRAKKMGFTTTVECFANMITDNKISNYYVSGKLSKYFLAAIPKFKNIYEKMDYFSKLELKDIYNKFDKYNADITTAYLFFKSQKINAFKISDIFLSKII